MFERVFLAVFAFLSDWIKNQDGKLVIMFAFFVVSVSYLYNENQHLRNQVVQMQTELDSIRGYVLECELHRAQLEIIVKNLEREIRDEKEENKKILESGARKNRNAGRQ